MKTYLKIFSWGFIISFPGTLPLGTINVTAFNLATSQNVQQAILFALSAVFVELIVIRITLAGASKINLNSRIFSYLSPIAIAFLIYLAVSSFISIGNTSSSNALILFPFVRSSILLGLLLSFLNPLYFPFWMGWNSILMSRNLLTNSTGIKTFYMTGAGIGSFAGHLAYILLGHLIVSHVQQFSNYLSLLLGSFYLAFAIYLLAGFVRKIRTISVT